ncbi:MocR-like pyridoxine biosynthesis transcription factor PdxR [Amycolatopsis sp. CA-230715]|uniref:MocR-like pyridoxine biosynthesis transcription factor PdxR n=1 Tax=Amycolatopsis sp. CA-230715 TaxID=2745196 RepID=UPI001C01545D|nr:PLP-dependent aminotransferase family protein [Amycolatopsis sp. CA-230715]QWF77576.1 HTH-type transcriptional regulatory protein GabR [Amycolatopsis sp. CA-230715]
MDLHVALSGRGDLAARIYRQLLEAILDGRLRAGDRLPPTRELARTLEVSRNTVAVAYDRLTAEGFVVSRVGAGTFVAAPATDRTRGRRAPGGAGIRPRAVWRDVPVSEGPAETPEFDFRVGVPDPSLFPHTTWRRFVARELRPDDVPAGYGDPAGHEGLRAAIARYTGVARSVRAAAEDVLITQGAQQALDLVGKVLIDPGTRVAVEDPGYPPARRIFHTLGARVTAVPVDSEGIDVAAIPPDTRLVYVTPSHQFPLGTPMSLARRTALLDWAERHGAVLVEDDYDTEFRFEDRPLEPLQSLDPAGRVLYVGTFSKTMLPSLRLGFLVAPASLRPALRAAKQLSDWQGDLAVQAALARFIDEGLLARHVRRAAREYGARRGRIKAGLAEEFGGRLELVPAAAGLHLCAHLGPQETVEVPEALSRARKLGVVLDDLADYHAEGRGRAGFVLGYGAVRTDRIAEGVRRLAASF